MERELETTRIKSCVVIHHCTSRAKRSFVQHMGLLGSNVRTRLATNRELRCPMTAQTVPIQCPYSAHTVPIGKTHSAHTFAF